MVCLLLFLGTYLAYKKYAPTFTQNRNGKFLLLFTITFCESIGKNRGKFKIGSANVSLCKEVPRLHNSEFLNLLYYKIRLEGVFIH